jgi:hypothetical protein
MRERIRASRLPVFLIINFGHGPSARDNLNSPIPAVNERNGGFSPASRGLLHCGMFNFGKPKTAGDWIVHIAGALVAILLVWWMLRMYVL